MANGNGSKLEATGTSAIGGASASMNTSQEMSGNVFENTKQSVRELQQAVDEMRDSIEPVLEGSVTFLKALVIGVIGFTDVLILQLLLLIFNSKSVWASLLFTQIFMTLFFILPAIMIYKYDVNINVV